MSTFCQGVRRPGGKEMWEVLGRDATAKLVRAGEVLPNSDPFTLFKRSALFGLETAGTLFLAL